MKSGQSSREFARVMSGYMPKFADVFDEETFYIFAFLVVIGSIIAAFIASKYIKLKEA